MNHQRTSADLGAVLEEEITNTMRNCGVKNISELTPDMVGPAGPWVRGNMSPWREVKAKL